MAASKANIMITVDRSWRPWSDLPEEILGHVVGWLSLVDRIRFRAVCKDWLLSPCHSDNIIPKIPWVIGYCSLPHRTKWSFFEPCCKLPYIMEDNGWFDDEKQGTITKTGFCASRCGWVLLHERIYDSDYHIYRTYRHHVYHPLSKKLISLPELELQERNCRFNTLATFSSNPTSPTSPPDSVFTVSIINGSSRYFFVSTYSSVDETWKTYQDHPHPYFSIVNVMAYMGGSVYCYNRDEGLSSFNIDTQEWKLLSNRWTFNDYRPYETRELVVYDGHLHVVCLSRLWTPLCNIFRYDWSDKAWKKMSSLEGGAIFLGPPSFGIPAGEQTKMVANRVYCLDEGSPPRFVVYSKDAGDKSKLSVDKIYCQSWPEEIPDIMYIMTMMGSDIEIPSYTWMDPPF